MNQCSVQRQQSRCRLLAAAAAFLFVLLVLPALAVIRVAQFVDTRIVIGYLGAVSALTVVLYWRDKRRAEANGWRTPESNLHLTELLGGWPAAFVAQRTFRHKISKRSYQIEFWAIVVLHQAASFDFLHEWQYSRSALLLLHQLLNR